MQGIFEKMDVKNLQKILRRKNERGLTGQKLKIIANCTVKLENLKMNQLKIICGANNLKCPRTAKKADLIMILNNHRRFLEVRYIFIIRCIFSGGILHLFSYLHLSSAVGIID